MGNDVKGASALIGYCHVNGGGGHRLYAVFEIENNIAI